jgi:CRISPR system Cascade subunit CasA
VTTHPTGPENRERSATSVGPREPAGGHQLTDWLVGLVRSRDYGTLAELRRPSLDRPAHIQAGWFTFPHSKVFPQVAFLFAVFHRGAVEPSKGSGSLGTAARRIGSSLGYGPDDAGAARLMDRLSASRRPPLRHLQHAIARLRSCDATPPYWPTLADDLVRWSAGSADVRYQWAVDFYRPSKFATRNPSPTEKTKESLT